MIALYPVTFLLATIYAIVPKINFHSSMLLPLKSQKHTFRKMTAACKCTAVKTSFSHHPSLQYEQDR